MKKFLLIFLIAIVACAEINTFDQTEVELEKKAKEMVKKAIGKAIEVSAKVKDFLKKNELYDPLVKVLKKEGKIVAEKLCSRFAHQENCKTLLNNVDANGEVVLKIAPIIVALAPVAAGIAWDIFKHVNGW